MNVYTFNIKRQTTFETSDQIKSLSRYNNTFYTFRTLLFFIKITSCESYLMNFRQLLNIFTDFFYYLFKTLLFLVLFHLYQHTTYINYE